MSEFPAQAKVVVVGGGIMGCGIAYHLAHEGWTDVVLLEKAELTSGSTWHAAGQITHSTSSYALGKCVDYNIGLYAGALQKETGQNISWHGCGSFRLAYNQDELDWLHHTLSVGRTLGFRMEMAQPERISELHPFYNMQGVLGGLYTPDDGHVDPSEVTQGLAAGARKLGARIIRQCRATDIKQQSNGEWLVSTEQGDILCEHVVNAGGTYARQMGEWSGLQLPMTSMTHHYFVTDTVPEFLDMDGELPVIRDDRRVSGYIRMEQKSGLIGIYEKVNPRTVWEDHCPWEAEHELFAPDYERVMPWLEAAMDRMPVFSELGIKRDVHGAISHPPDGNPLIGPAPGVRNYWCCCGTQIGIGWGPGLTRELARWMVHGAADLSMREFDPRRFGDYAVKDWQIIKAKEDYCLRHEVPFPHFNRLAGRPIKPSPIYDALKERGAVFEEVYGHERPRWFATGDIEQRDYYSFRRNEVEAVVSAEVEAVRSGVGLMDIDAFTKVRVEGTDASVFLDGLIANRLPKKAGSVILTHMLNELGRIELELTIVHQKEGVYYLMCAAFFEQRLLDHLDQHIGNMQCTVTNLSDEWAALTLQGPKSRHVLKQVTSAPLDNKSFRWLSAQFIDVGNHDVLALRMSYTGELGWEFHGSRDAIADTYHALWAAGQDHGIVNYGSFAMNVMRMEKAFPGAGELTNEVTLPEADVMRFVKLEDREFLGKAATEASMNGTLKWIRVYLSIEADGNSDGHGGEPVVVNGKVVGSTSSMAYSSIVDRILAFAYVQPDVTSDCRIQVSIMGQLRDAVMLVDPVYDPLSELPRTDESV